MLKVLKYTGLGAGTAVLIGLAGTALAFALLIYNVFFAPNLEYYRGRFLLTATVEVDGELKRGSSVYEVAYNRLRRGSPGSGSPIMGARGTMPVIDMGEQGTLVFLFEYLGMLLPEKQGCKRIHPASVPTLIMAGAYNTTGSLCNAIGAMSETTKSFSIGKYTFPAIVIPRGGKVQDAEKFTFCALDTVLGTSVKPIDIQIQRTEQHQLFENIVSPDWLASWQKDFEYLKANNSGWARKSVWPHPRPSNFKRENFYKG